MGRALLILGWLSTAGLLVTALLGFQVSPETGVGLHLLVALLTALLVLFSHSWIMFYLIGTGKAIKTAVVEHGLDPALVQLTIDFKNRSYPWLMAAIGVVMATFILGGGVATHVLPSWVHLLLAIAAVLVQLRALILEGEVILANDRLMRRVENLAAGRG